MTRHSTIRPKGRRAVGQANKIRHQVTNLRVSAGQIRHNAGGNLRLLVIAGEVEATADRLAEAIDPPPPAGPSRAAEDTGLIGVESR